MQKKLVCIFILASFVITHTQAEAHGQTISALEAREIALAITGGGTLNSLELVTDAATDVLAYRIIIVNNGARYEVFVNASTGDIFRFIAGMPAEAATQVAPPATTAEPEPGTRTQQPVSRNPFRPNVSRAEAVEIGYAFLADQGFPNASFRRHSGIDWEWRRWWAWELYFWDIGTEIELYIDMHTGEVVNFEIEGRGGGRR